METHPNRREFVCAVGGALAAMTPTGRAADSPPSGDLDAEARKYLAARVYSRQEVDDWLSGKGYPFAKYDAGQGWLLKDARFADGIDGSTSTYKYGKYDERRMIAYADLPCRINTYGDSYTQCHQVSDGESWQEVLARHLHEPIRNFGVGAYSAYQAYLRMRREEPRAPAPYIIFNIYDDDHSRNLDAWRLIRTRKDKGFLQPTLPHLQVNFSTGRCVERPNPCPTPESIYNLCDLDWVLRRFRDDFVLALLLASQCADEGNPERAYKILSEFARKHGPGIEIDRKAPMGETARSLRSRAALLATQQVVEWTEAFAKEHGKKVLYVLSFRSGTMAERVRDGRRWDQPFVDFLKARKVPYVDLMEAHLADFESFKIPIAEYLKRFYIGHYNPLGNVFTAFAIKSKVVEMLDPKPSAYLPP